MSLDRWVSYAHLYPGEQQAFRGSALAVRVDEDGPTARRIAYRLTAEVAAKFRASSPLLAEIAGTWPILRGAPGRRFASLSRGERAEADWDAMPGGAMPEEMPEHDPMEPALEVVSVIGPIATRAGMDDACTWVDGYDAIEARLRMALECADGVMLVIDSPGGDAAGCFEAVRRMRGMVEESGKPVIAYVDEHACSAAYALALIADEIHAPAVTTARVGSVGCVVVHAEVSKMLEAEGVTVSVFRSGPRKAEGLEVEPLAPETAARIQASVNECAAEFAALVGERRGMDPKTLADLGGASFTSARALDLGLIDGLATREEAIAMGIESAKKAAAEGNAPTAPAAAPAAPQASASTLSPRLAALLGTSDPDAAAALVESLKTSAETGKALAATAAAQAAEQKAQIEATERAALLDRGEREGRLTPHMRAGLAGYPIATLRDLIAGKAEDKEKGIAAVDPLLPVLPAALAVKQPAAGGAGAKAGSGSTGGPRGQLTDEERAAARLLGHTDEAKILEAKEALRIQDARMRGEVV